MTTSVDFLFGWASHTNNTKAYRQKITVMRILLIASLILVGFICAWGQDDETKFVVGPSDRSNSVETLPPNSFPQFSPVTSDVSDESSSFTVIEVSEEKLDFQSPNIQECCQGRYRKDDPSISNGTPDQDNTKTEEKFHWKPALVQSITFLSIQHAFRLTQDKTQQELGGPFFRDWNRSVGNLKGWRDSDSFITNYIAHPLQGALTGRIFVNNSDRAKKQEFGKSKKYWESRMKAMAWSAVWSTQFELGPVSEATIGNVGMHKRHGYSTMAYVDLVITPVVGTAVLVGEDAIDKYFLKNWLEKKDSSKMKVKLLRSLVTPTTSIANLLRGKMPWKRDERPL